MAKGLAKTNYTKAASTSISVVLMFSFLHRLLISLKKGEYENGK